MGHFDFLDMNFFTRADIFPGSIGTFRYRFQRPNRPGAIGLPDSSSTLQAWVYENTSFELAQDIETETFPWTEEGIAAMKAWLEDRLSARGSETYRIPYPPKSAE